MSALAKARSRRGAPKTGDVIAGKYHVIDIIGAGGMGVVVSARHVELGQTVAIKFLDAALAENTAVAARFFREARAATRIRSEHVTRVLDVARTDAGVPYMVMEHLAGTDLEKVVRTRGTLPVAEAIEYVLQACEALAEAHAAGVIHRDLKPSNLFLTHRADGSPLVKVLDFGISKIVDADGDSHDGATTTQGDMLGSPWYMSPEQVRDSKSVDARTDIWSLGVILYQFCTGRQAFRAETMNASLAKIVMDPPPPLRELNPDVPEDLERVILSCLEKEPERRLKDVAELATALSAFAPPTAQLSISRITRVIAAKTGTHSAPALTPPPSGDTPAPSGATPLSSSSSGATPPPAGQATGASAVTKADAPMRRQTPRWAFGLALLGTLGLGVLLARVLFPPSLAPAASAAPAPSPTVAPTAVPTEAATQAPIVVTAAATAAPPAASSAAARPTPPAARPAVPAAPHAKPAKRKLEGPVETSL
jgi:serine/threonine-protein kinase